MTVSAWLAKAEKLHSTCMSVDKAYRGGRLNTREATILNDLQHAIGSHHSRSEVTYREAIESLDEMFVWVKSGQKTPPLTKG